MTEIRPSFRDLAVEGVRGLQPYQPGKPIEELARELGLELDSIVKLASNENPMGPGTRAINAARDALTEVHRYPDGNGYSLKLALSRHHGVAPECITIGNGSNDVLALLAGAFLDTGREAVFSEHAFAVYPIVTQAVGATARVAKALPEGSDMPFGHDLAAMAAAVGPATRLVFIANPNNPTGTWLESQPLKDFLRAMPDDVIVVVDEAYFEYADADRYPDATQWLSAFPNLVVTRTFSKAYGLAGFRVGYALSHPGIAELLNRVRQPFNVNLVAQAAAEAALADQDYIRQSVAVNGEQRHWLHGKLQALGLTVLPSAANFLCFRVGARADAVYQGLLERGVIVRPVAGYGLPGYLRVTVGLPAENQRFIDALSELLTGET
ncbi:MAG: histidinol-phosphate transaminase [Ectothiorhodospiraceae bacterium]|nr:histidinol-phosphate transaminase [Ectothiorhodospiraceae bacterium]MCH8505304.1 histidinol-phosphate transaminase [Ectothiorhodospiraceae bacterium]